MPVITLPDGSQRQFPNPVTVAEVAASIGAGLAKAALAGRVDDRLVDTSFTIENDARLAIVTERDETDGLEIIRHSTAHLLAMAVQQLFPGAQVTIGPVIEDGFFYDFAYERPFTTEDLEKIEQRMTELAALDLPVQRVVMSRDEAVKTFDALGEKYKVAILSVTEGEEKPLKYPDMFAAAQLMVINKIDLLPYVSFDVARCIENAKRVNPYIQVIQVSATTRGTGRPARRSPSISTARSRALHGARSWILVTTRPGSTRRRRRSMAFASSIRSHNADAPGLTHLHVGRVEPNRVPIAAGRDGVPGRASRPRWAAPGSPGRARLSRRTSARPGSWRRPPSP